MANEVELASLDLRYQGFRLQQPALQERLLSSIAQRGIQEPLEGVDLSAGRAGGGEVHALQRLLDAALGHRRQKPSLQSRLLEPKTLVAQV